MYQVPLRFVKVSPDVAVCATRIVAIMSTKLYQTRETIKAERRANTLVNACGTDKARCAVLLDNGTIVSSPRSVDTLLKAIENANARELGLIKSNAADNKNLKVYTIGEDTDSKEVDISNVYDEEDTLIETEEDNDINDDEEDLEDGNFDGED